jgi:tetratricopeptide (TPR) repeat protein
MYQADGELDEALRLALVARARLGRVPEVSHTLGWIYYRRAQFREAIPALADTVSARPNVAAYRAHLGLAYWKGGDSARAREELEAALATPGDFVARDQAEEAAAQLEVERKALAPQP